MRRFWNHSRRSGQEVRQFVRCRIMPHQSRTATSQPTFGVSLFDTARQYRESFDVYGTKKSFEWTLVENEPHIIHTAKKPEHEIPSKVEVPITRIYFARTDS